jgi:hypothetical protein
MVPSCPSIHLKVGVSFSHRHIQVSEQSFLQEYATLTLPKPKLGKVDYQPLKNYATVYPIGSKNKSDSSHGRKKQRQYLKKMKNKFL